MDLRQTLEHTSLSGVVTKAREKAILAIPSTSYDPNGPKTEIVDGFAIQVDQSPVALGQLILYAQVGGQFNRDYSLMVAIDFDDGLRWVTADIGSVKFVPTGPLPPVGNITEI